jgi:hypothetical protein
MPAAISHKPTSLLFTDGKLATGRSESESELLYEWRFTAKQFVLAKSHMRLTTSNFIFQLNICCYNLHVTSSLTGGRVCHLKFLLVHA